LIYKFRCTECGEYNVKKETFERFAANMKRIEADIEKGAAGGVVVFDYRCPSCLETGPFTLNSKTLTLWPKARW